MGDQIQDIIREILQYRVRPQLTTSLIRAKIQYLTRLGTLAPLENNEPIYLNVLWFQ